MNAKGDLIARLVALGLGTPTFEAEAHGPPHERTFAVRVWAGGQVLATAEGRTKKDAERLAAESALRGLAGQTVAGQTTTRQTVSPQPTPTPDAPWPIYAPVLAGAIEAATEFADEHATLDDMRRAAADFYRALLADLGHGPEEA